MAGLSIPKLPAGSAMGDGSSWRDKLMMLSLALNTDPQVRAQLPLLMMQQKQRAQQGAAETDLANFASGRAIPQRPAALDLGTDQPAQPPVAEPQPDQPADVPMLGNLGGRPPMLKPMAAPRVPMRDPAADSFGGPVSVRTALPMLARLTAAGGDPTKWQALIAAAQLRPLTPLNTTHGPRSFNPETGDYKVLEDFPEKPEKPTHEWREITNPDGSTSFIDLADAGGPLPPMRNVAPAAAIPTRADSGQPRGVRNNNPLNVSALPSGQAWDGQVGTDGQYAVFATPEQGFAAADKNLQAYASKHGINTISGVIQRWAPASENDTGSYIATVAKDLGIDANQPLDFSQPDVRSSLLRSMAKVELGQAVPQTAAPTAGLRVPTLTGGAGADIPTRRMVPGSAPGTKKVGGEDSPELPPALAGLSGDALLKAMTPSEAAQVKALAEGRMQFPGGFAISKPYWQRMLNAVSQYDPTFDAVNYSSRAKTRSDFTSGKSAQNITALNTVIGHLDHLDHTIDGLGNFGMPLNNWMAHGIAHATGTDARIREFETAKVAVANELTRVFRGSGGAEADIQAWQKQLDSASSPTALRSVVHSMAELINSRVEALGEQYSQGMGSTKDPLTLLTPDKAKAFARMHAGIGPNDKAKPAAGGFKYLGPE